MIPVSTELEMAENRDSAGTDLLKNDRGKTLEVVSDNLKLSCLEKRPSYRYVSFNSEQFDQYHLCDRDFRQEALQFQVCDD